MIASLEEATAIDQFQFAVAPAGLRFILFPVPLADARGYMLLSLRDSGIVV